ncbi:MAG: lysophospholipid acyltransferase family protein [Pseudomonadota bacterium]
MILIRSLLFYILFYASNAIQMVFWTPVFFIIPRKLCWRVVRLWAKSHLILQHWTIGSVYEFRGLENIPTDRPFIVASKHQSTWETYTQLLFLDDPSYVLKRELMWIPLFGWYAAKMNVVPVNRGKRSAALASMTLEAERQYHAGRKIIIYPEGTRTSAGAKPYYKYGVTHLYDELGATILPIALNSGLFWPRKSSKIYPGKIIMEFLPPIEPGLRKSQFSAELENRIETATTALIEEALTSNDPPPLPILHGQSSASAN